MTRTEAPETTPPDSSRTTPDTRDWPAAEYGDRQEQKQGNAMRMTRKFSANRG